MTTAFQEALEKIKLQSQILESGDEKAVESVVIPPLLMSLGWDTFDLSEVYPQWRITSEANDKVDYALRLNEKNRLFIEAKQWSNKLNAKNEEQLRDYCNAAGKDKPRLAALTNGRQWRLYLSPLSAKSKDETPNLRRFLEFDITTVASDELEGYFNTLLARESVQPGGGAIAEALRLRDIYVKNRTVMNELRNTWNKLVNSQKEQSEMLWLFAQHHKIEADDEQIRRFLGSNDSLFNPVSITSAKQPGQKPTCFRISIEGKEETVPVTKWADLNLELCNFMYERHPDTFSTKVLPISTYWFSNTSDNVDGHSPVGDSGISVRTHGASAAIKQNCKKIVATLGYSESAFSIQEA